EALQGKAPRRQAEAIAMTLCLERGAQRLAQARDLHTQRLEPGGRLLLSPEVLEQAVAGDDLVRAQQQETEQRALTVTTKRKRLPVTDDLERSQDPVLHQRPTQSPSAPT